MLCGKRRWVVNTGTNLNESATIETSTIINSPYVDQDFHRSEQRIRRVRLQQFAWQDSVASSIGHIPSTYHQFQHHQPRNRFFHQYLSKFQVQWSRDEPLGYLDY
jgi:transposase-like protein